MPIPPIDKRIDAMMRNESYAYRSSREIAQELKAVFDANNAIDAVTVSEACGEEWPHPSSDVKSQRPTPPPYGHPISKEELIAYRKRLFSKLDEVLLAKGNDYNSAQQNAGDTLFNLRVCAILGVVPSPEDGILVRLADKLMRVVSLTRPSATQKVKDESIEDTIGDAINYLSYLSAMIIKSRRGTL